MAGGGFEYRVLGPLEVWWDGAPVRLGGPRHRALLAALLARAGTVVSAARLAEMLWESPPPRATELLWVRVAEVRRAMREVSGRPATELETHDQGYLLRVPDDAVDRWRFERMVADGLGAGRRGDHRAAAARQRAALALWRGPAFADVADRSWVEAEAARLAELRIRAIEARGDADLAVGRHEEMIAELVALVAEHPLNERFWGQLMRARFRAGRTGEAVATFGAARRELAERLGVEPGPDLQRLHTTILRADATEADATGARDAAGAPDAAGAGEAAGTRGTSAARDAADAGNGAPARSVARPLTSFVGRERELAAAGRLLGAHRLVTVTGVGGVGKTRLAAEVAGRARTAWLVELAALEQPDLLADAVGDALGLPSHPARPRTGLVLDHLRAVDGLLVLDNCEHLTDAAAGFAAALLAACPGMRVLATSRERLGITGEALLPLHGLALPGTGEDDAESAGRAPAVRLFAERARAADPGFALADGTAAAVAAICRKLDGVPLAIELAAARMNAFSPGELAARLDDRFGLLSRGDRTAAPRHRTLHAVVDWSYRLLDADERRLFTVLSAFAGRFGLDWAEQLAADHFPPAEVARLVAALVDKSLLLREADRYRMLETLRAYGLERLDARGELTTVRDRHAALVAGLADTLWNERVGSARERWMHLLDTTMEQFRAAMEWAVARDDAATALRVAAALCTYWHSRGQYVVGRRWTTLALEARGPVPPAVRARALSGLTLLTSMQGDLAASRAAGREAATIFTRTGDRRGYGLALRRLATAEGFGGSHDRADELMAESHAVAVAADWPWLLGWTLTQQGLSASARGDWGLTAALSAEAESVLRDVGDPEVLAYAWLLRAEAARNLSGPLAGAAGLCRALRAFAEHRLLWGTSLALFYASLVYGDLGRPRHEVMLLSAGHEVRRAAGGSFFSWLAEQQERELAGLRRELGDEDFEVQWRTGRIRPLAALVDEVCADLKVA
ncbi:MULTISPECIES: AfsR/SARP family transcriptional regulator [Catenuloplanes]|uniref:ATPase/DNA-binding SARP family transcriptional activator n=1 Tax=Catenuloplanes niger TaxID=587534 RepID=A0AAE4A0R4_9ACTN|nr:BTAD domain-containing putative transcriptional regulator [Catenuloplanes niger]MDR7328311.1 putative ATPase/DNA-binding SARP family transcriptional activator [Catenuloplanes niger]